MTKKVGLKETLKPVKLATKVDLPSSSIKSNIAFDVEKAVNKIHMAPKEKFTRLSIDVTEGLHEVIKIRVAKLKKTTREYVLDLIEHDLSI